MTSRGFDKPSLPFAKDSDTSVAAAESMTEDKVNRQQDKIARAVHSAGRVGLTAEQVAHWTSLTGNSVRPRLIELCEKGILYKSRDTRTTHSGRKASVYRHRSFPEEVA